MQNILFVLHNHFGSNSAIHVHNFANHLVDLGLDCIVAVPQDKETIALLTSHRYQAVTFDETRNLKQIFKNHQGPDVVHAWTPREIVRIFCDELRHQYAFKLIIHLEDNEEYLLEKFTQKSSAQILRDDIEPFPAGLAHPQRYREFLAQADAVTVIIDKLGEFVPETVPTMVLWPGVDKSLFYPRQPDRALASKLNLPLNSRVLVYTGNVHPANAVEVRSLYLAVAMMNREGHPTVLIRTGKDYCSYLGADDRWAQKYVINVGYVELSQIPEITALADVLIQPGRSDRFNDYRFPSKLPEFMAMGKPVILPATNIGAHMEHGHHAMVLPIVDALHIVKTVVQICDNSALQHKLSKGAVSFAQSHLDWHSNARQLMTYYQTICNDGVSYDRSRHLL